MLEMGNKFCFSTPRSQSIAQRFAEDGILSWIMGNSVASFKQLPIIIRDKNYVFEPQLIMRY